MMTLAIYGQTTSGCSTNYLTKMQHSPAFRVTSASFNQPPKSFLQKLFERLVATLNQAGQP